MLILKKEQNGRALGFQARRGVDCDNQEKGCCLGCILRRAVMGHLVLCASRTHARTHSLTTARPDKSPHTFCRCVVRSVKKLNSALPLDSICVFTLFFFLPLTAQLLVYVSSNTIFVQYLDYINMYKSNDWV